MLVSQSSKVGKLGRKSILRYSEVTKNRSQRIRITGVGGMGRGGYLSGFFSAYKHLKATLTLDVFQKGKWGRQKGEGLTRLRGFYFSPPLRRYVSLSVSLFTF